MTREEFLKNKLEMAKRILNCQSLFYLNCVPEEDMDAELTEAATEAELIKTWLNELTATNLNNTNETIGHNFDEGAVEEALMGILTSEWTTEDTVLLGSRFEIFDSEGIVTRNKGIVIKMPCGQEFQLTIARSR